MGRPSVFSTEILSTTVVRPSESKQLSDLMTKALSIVDNTVANFSPTGAVLFFSPPSADETATSDLSPGNFVASLSTCLNTHPWLAGHLHFLDPSDSRCPQYQRRYGRLAVTFGSSSHFRTPGVQFITATTSAPLASILQKPSDSASGLQVSVLPESSAFFPPTSSHPLAFSQLKPSAPDVPATIIQYTAHPCGSISLGAKIAHPLSDTQGLFTFLQVWAATHRLMFSSDPRKRQTSTPTSFSLSQLDAAAEGDLNSLSGPDPDLVSTSRSLPLSRFSWWQRSPLKCPWDSAAAKVPEELRPYKDDDGDPLPWAEWDVSKKIECRAIHFTPKEISQIFRDATAGDENPSLTIHTALVAHTWRLITGARQAAQYRRSHPFLQKSKPRDNSTPSDSNVSDREDPDQPPSQFHHLHLTLGLRPRLRPPLPPTSLGSPILNSTISAPLSSLLTSSPSSTSQSPSPASHSSSPSSLSTTASLIQNTISHFTSQTLGALLHDLAYEPCPWRIWHAFLGSKRLLVTSWVKSGVWDVDFTSNQAEKEKVAFQRKGGRGHEMVGVLPLMPSCEGLVVVIEKPGEEKKGKGGKWWSDGVDVICWLDDATWREMLGEIQGEGSTFE